MNFNRKSLGLLAGISTLALAQVWATQAFAQQQTGAELDAVVVTTRKTSENIISTPVAITAVTSASLTAKGVTSILGLQDFTPGFRMVNQTFGRNDRGYSTFVMRGIYGGDGQGRQPVRVFVDGVPISTGMVAGLDAIDRVEVVAGPQSAYFGRSTFAGAVNFITRTPAFKLGSNLSVDAGGYGYGEVKGSVEGPIYQDKVSGRLSGRYYTYDGSHNNQFGSSKLGSQETKSIAGTLYLKPTENLKIKVFGQYWQDDDGPASQAMLTVADYNCNPSGGAIKTYYCGQLKKVPENRLYFNTNFSQSVINTLASAPYVGSIVGDGFSDHMGLHREAFQFFSSFEYALPASWTLSGNVGTGLDRFTVIIDGTQQVGSTYIVQAANRLKDFSGELRLQSPTYFDRVKFLVGTNYLDTSNNGVAPGYRGNAQFISQPITNASDPNRLYSRTFGLFGAVHVDLTSKLKFDLEGRNQQDKIIQKILPNANSLAGAVLVAAGKTYTTFTPKAILSYQVTPEVMVYGSYSKGTRPGSFNAGIFALAPAARAALISQTGVSLAVAPEKLDMYELGLKGEFFDRRARLLLSGYYGNWTDRQVSAQVLYFPPGAAGSTFLTAVTGGSSVHLYGIEAKGEFRVTSDLSLEGTIAYNESDIQSTFCSPCLVLTGKSNFPGNRLPGYPAVTGSASVNYSHDIGNDLRGHAGVDYVYAGRQYDTEANLAYSAASNRINARIGVSKDRYMVELYGKNIFNDRAPVAIFRAAQTVPSGNTLIVSPPEKPLFGVRLTATY